MTQSAPLITLETFLNVGSGAVISWLVCWLCLPWWGYEPPAGTAAEITLLFFIVSFVRSWCWRWLFNAYDHERNEIVVLEVRHEDTKEGMHGIR